MRLLGQLLLLGDEVAPVVVRPLFGSFPIPFSTVIPCAERRCFFIFVGRLEPYGFLRPFGSQGEQYKNSEFSFSSSLAVRQ